MFLFILRTILPSVINGHVHGSPPYVSRENRHGREKQMTYARACDLHYFVALASEPNSNESTSLLRSVAVGGRDAR